MTVPIPANAVVYRTTVDDPRTSTVLAIAPNGRCLLLAGSNRGQRSLPVGRFQGSAPPGLMTGLRQRLFSEAFRQSATLDTVAPDEACRMITIPGEESAPTAKLACNRAASREFLAVEDIFTSLIEHLRQFPATVLLAEIARSSNQGTPRLVASGPKLAIVLKLRNPGPVPVLVPSPEKWGRTEGYAELSIMRASGTGKAQGAGKAQVQGIGMQWFASCDTKSILRFQPRSVRGLVPVMPGGSLEIDLEPAFNCPEGRYIVDLTVALNLYDGDRIHQMAVVASPPQFNIDFAGLKPHEQDR
jgi:hypothetical protein